MGHRRARLLRIRSKHFHVAARLDTARVYAALNGADSSAARLASTPKDARELAVEMGSRANDLEVPARSLIPAIGDTLAALAAAPGCLLARMSGSGPACFGIFSAPASASAAANRLRREHPEWWVAEARVPASDLAPAH